MTNPNTTARQAGLTELIQQLYGVIADARSKEQTLVTISVTDLDDVLLAAHSADARNAIDKEVCDAFNSGFAAGEAAGIRKARNAEGVALTDEQIAEREEVRYWKANEPARAVLAKWRAGNE
ncbi:hypothetical protein [Cupriavidus pauculus]|uniref:Uncharacterized protein n=1 Tax=Cupriavidus pauculus TaxID=82633 RepID=A0A3G8H3M0_9BURK|nr:hypothetical protein [Cupriavidus pauculus]AZG14909.1 hypothetical protein EHF44_16610 [Cupriavidus pauculus]